MEQLFVEFIGTFLLVAIILSVGEAFPIGLTLAVVIWFGAKVSGAHYNPAVSVTQYLDGKLSMNGLISYTVAQILGAVSAYYFHKNFVSTL